MGADEEGTHERLRAHLGQLVDPKIREHNGRAVKNTGDGLLAEFASVVDGVRCAAEVQRAMIDRERQMPDERRIRFRIGINLGDIIVDGDDIFTVRRQCRCTAGSPRRARRDLHLADGARPDPRQAGLRFRGSRRAEYATVARPVRVYALRPEAVAELPAPMASPTPPVSQTAMAPRLSIVVLPFTNLSNDPEQEYFADGITEDVTTDLSRLADMFVISRNTAFTYQDKRVDTKQIGRELGVRYVLEGSVRRSGTQLRVNAQLIDAATDAHLWAQRFDGHVTDPFALQDEITAGLPLRSTSSW